MYCFQKIHQLNSSRNQNFVSKNGSINLNLVLLSGSNKIWYQIKETADKYPSNLHVYGPHYFLLTALQTSVLNIKEEVNFMRGTTFLYLMIFQVKAFPGTLMSHFFWFKTISIPTQTNILIDFFGSLSHIYSQKIKVDFISEKFGLGL